MAIKLLKVGNSFNVPQKQYICDTETERNSLKAYFGDLCLVIETGLTYILNSLGEWVVYAIGGGGGNANTDLIAPDFNSEQNYSVNSTVIYEGALYRATTNVEAGEFDSSEWVQIYATTPLGVPVIASQTAPIDTSVLWLFEEGDEPYGPTDPVVGYGEVGSAIVGE